MLWIIRTYSILKPSWCVAVTRTVRSSLLSIRWNGETLLRKVTVGIIPGRSSMIHRDWSTWWEERQVSTPWWIPYSMSRLCSMTVITVVWSMKSAKCRLWIWVIMRMVTSRSSTWSTYTTIPANPGKRSIGCVKWWTSSISRLLTAIAVMRITDRLRHGMYSRPSVSIRFVRVRTNIS